MSAKEELEGEISAREADIRERIRNACLSLGIKAAREHEMLGFSVGGSLLDAALKATDDRRAAEENGRAIHSFLESFHADEETLSAALEEARNAEAVIRRLSIRLGALIYEQCSFSLLDRNEFSTVYEDISRSTETKKGFLSATGIMTQAVSGLCSRSATDCPTLISSIRI